MGEGDAWWYVIPLAPAQGQDPISKFWSCVMIASKILKGHMDRKVKHFLLSAACADNASLTLTFFFLRV